MASPDPPFKVKALYEYSSPHEDDLNFAADEIVTVTALEDDDWYFGEYVDRTTGEKKEGIFPKNFVERVVVEVPARPVRSARKSIVKTPEEEPQHQQQSEPEPVAPQSPPPPPAAEPPTPVEQPKPVEVRSPPPPLPPADEPKPAPKPVVTPKSPSQVKPALKAAPPPAPPAAAAADKPAPSNKPPPPDKPSSSSFKDRLALFNKGGAAPVTPYNPLKPKQDFVKKPFVPPPPSKNAYVPPPISHVPKPKRDEDTRPPPPPPEPSAKGSFELERDAEENKPKQSLKERIAMLQTQQLNPEALHKPKPRPKPKRVTSEKSDNAEDEEGDIVSPQSVHRDEEPVGPTEAEETETPVRSKKSVDIKREEIPDDSSVGEADVSSASLGPAEARVRRTAPAHQSDFGDDEGANDTPYAPDSDDEEEEEEEIDPEIQRKIALRERMMKMSGGMGMHGMFGPPLGIPMGGAPAKKKKSVSGKSVADEEEVKPPEIPRAPVPVLPFAMPKVQSPPPVEKEPEEEDEAKQAPAGRRISEDLPAEEEVDVEDMKPSRSGEHPHGPRPMPPRSPPSVHDSPVSPPVPTERPAPPPPPVEARPPPPPPPPPVQGKTPSEGSESGDEMSMQATGREEQPRAPPPPPGRPSSSSTSAPMSPPPPPRRQSQVYANPPMSPGGNTPLSPGGGNKRASYQRGLGSIPPIPGGLSSPTMTRPPPPPPPFAALHSLDEPRSDTEEEVTEYEADYDTDIANKVAHRDALTAQHGKDRRDAENEDTPLPSPTLTTSHPPTRSVPPPPPPVPSMPPPAPRRSVDMPRAPPPLPPQQPPPPPVQQGSENEDDREYDPYRYGAPISPQSHTLPPPPPPQHAPLPPPLQQPPPPPPGAERLPSRGGSRQSMDAPRLGTASTGRTSMDMQRPSNPRASMDVPRGGLGSRRSMDQSRPHLSDYVARDIDLGASSLWWTQPRTLPPSLQSRIKDIRYELEDTPQGKELYLLFHDYSQTIITAQFSREDPAHAVLEQRHEPPPAQPRQDQLEDFQSQFGARIYGGVKSREGTVVGDGDAMSLIKELFALVPGALQPVGTRAFGCLVYANLANASTQQFDEIRPGDIVTFRNTRFQGHKGGLHQKYSMEVGKPEHVAVVADWDGTKKKIRVFEQGRQGEGKKVRNESYKMGDLRSGEVKVWRVAGREWVGWGEPPL